VLRPSAFVLIVATLVASPAPSAPPTGVGDPTKAHWSFRPCSRPAVPSPQDSAGQDWVRTPIDAFLLARLRKEGLYPAPEADKRTLIRRLCFDLTGLPPTTAEVAAFVNDRSEDAYDRLVDRLLASPHYGERWGRHWLDVVRFAETEGFEYDRYRPGAWRYRDYVIRSFNEDKPFDQFIREQLAGDEMEPDNRELRIAAGFHRLGPVRRNAGNQDVAFSRDEFLTERTDAIGAVFLGLTVGCARCHDHKFDEISQTDYYRLQAFLAAIHEENLAWTDRSGSGTPPGISSVRDIETQRTPIYVLKRGNPEKRGKQVGPRILDAFLPEEAPELAADIRKPRESLARWITDPKNPLTARVLVNRVWQYHFGQGIVATPNDFGRNGSPPSHPELLDYLANELIANGWQLKPMHRMIVRSHAYRQSSSRLDRAKDPDNRLLGHFPRRRLEAEEVRDAMLASAGRLNTKFGGPSVVLPVDPDLTALLYDPKQWTVTPDSAEHTCRSIYLLAKRNVRLPFLEVFDQPDAQTSCACRESSTHAPQALELLNGRLANELAAAFAQRLLREAGPDPVRQIERAYLVAVGRPPTEKEQALAVEFLRKQPLTEFTLAIFNLNTFLYVN